MSKKESYWFSHDSNAANNPKLLALINKYGFEGYGRWWRLLERLRDCDEYRFDISAPFAWEVIGQDLKMTAAEAETFVHDGVEYFQLLETDGKYLWSNSLLNRMEFWEKRREVLRERGRKGGLASGKKRNNEAQVELKSSTTNVKLEPNEANETKPNQTKRDETTLYIVEDGEEVKGEVVMEKEKNVFEVLRNKALADGQHFVLPYVTTGKMNKEQLGDWLAAFNRWLDFTGEQPKEERDYRRHFAAWFKYHDPQKEDPKQYNPAGMPLKQAKVQTQAPISKTVPLPVAIPADKPKGRFSKGDNKFDMYWLKNLRDEVRSMGG